MRGRGTGWNEPPPGALAAASAASDAVATWQWDIGTDILCGDDRMAALYGVDPARLRGGTPVPVLFDCIHPDDRGTVVARIRRAAEEGGSYVMPYRLLAPGGRIRWVLSCGRCAHDAAGRPTEGRGVVIDLTGAEAHPLERAAEHGLAVRRAVDDWHDPFLRRLADMLLMEIGRHLAADEVPRAPESRRTY